MAIQSVGDAITNAVFEKYLESILENSTNYLFNELNKLPDKQKIKAIEKIKLLASKLQETIKEK